MLDIARICKHLTLSNPPPKDILSSRTCQKHHFVLKLVYSTHILTKNVSVIDKLQKDPYFNKATQALMCSKFQKKSSQLQHSI